MPSYIQIPYKPSPDLTFLMGVRTEERPDAAALMQEVLSWAANNVSVTLRDIVSAYVKFTMGALEVVSASEMSEVLADVWDLNGVEDILGREGLRWCILIYGAGLNTNPGMQVWFSRTAACALRAMYGEPVVDLGNRLCDERFADISVIDQGDLMVHLSQHLRVLGSPAGQGMLRLSTTGMNHFGLPDLEIAACEPDLASAAQDILCGAAQYVIGAAARAAQDLQADDCSSEQAMLAMPETIILNEAVLTDALGHTPYSAVKPTQFQLHLTPPSEVSAPLLQIVCPTSMSGAGNAWLRATVNHLFPKAPSVVIVPSDAPPPRAQLGLDVPPYAKTPSELRELLLQTTIACNGTLAVKGPFARPSAEMHLEFMWVAVRHWAEGAVHGHLMDDSIYDSHHVVGMPVVFREHELTDWRLTELTCTTGGPISCSTGNT